MGVHLALGIADELCFVQLHSIGVGQKRAEFCPRRTAVLPEYVECRGARGGQNKLCPILLPGRQLIFS